MYSDIWEIKQVDNKNVFDVLNPFCAVLTLLKEEEDSKWQLFTAKGILLKENEIPYEFDTLEDGVEFCKKTFLG